MSVLAPPKTPTSAEDLVERLMKATLGSVDLLSIYVGDRLGWYRSLLTDGPATAEELASRTGTHPRYAREWLEQQAMTGLLTVASDGAGQRRFTMPDATAQVLTDQSSLSYMAPLSRMMAAVGGQLPALLEAYRTGGGVGWAQFGVDARESQADLNRPWFEQALAAALAGVPAIDAQLRRPGVRIGDIGCGGAWSTIALARAYPQATVDGFDIDPASVQLARTNVESARLTDQVSIHGGDAASIPEASFDAVFAFECVHDMPRPVEVLDAARRSLRPGGSMIIMDEAVAESFEPPGDDLERLMYGFSIFICLPDGMSHQPTAATGTVMRPETLRDYARSAGFERMEILPIEDFGFWRFYYLPT